MDVVIEWINEKNEVLFMKRVDYVTMGDTITVTPLVPQLKSGFSGDVKPSAEMEALFRTIDVDVMKSIAGFRIKLLSDMVS